MSHSPHATTASAFPVADSNAANEQMHSTTSAAAAAPPCAAFAASQVCTDTLPFHLMSTISNSDHEALMEIFPLLILVICDFCSQHDGALRISSNFSGNQLAEKCDVRVGGDPHSVRMEEVEICGKRVKMRLKFHYSSEESEETAAESSSAAKKQKKPDGKHVN